MSEHPSLEELLASPLDPAVGDHLARCVACRVAACLARDPTDEPRSETWLSEALASVADPEGTASVASHVRPSAAGPLIGVQAGSVSYLIASLDEADPAVLQARFEALRAVAHPSLASWRVLRLGDPPIAECDPVPPRTVRDALTSNAGALVPLLVQITRALDALHQHELAHGGLAQGPLGVTDLGRLIVGPASLTCHGTMSDDLRELGALLQAWDRTAPLAALAALADELHAGLVPDLDALTRRVLALVEARHSGALRYELQGLLGTGGRGEVHQARDRILDRTVALKALLPSAALDTDAFLHEARLTAGLQHPGVVPVHEIGQLTDGRPYYTMEEVRGARLDEAIRRVHQHSTREEWGEGPDGWTLRRLVGSLERLCETVAFAHSRGIVHCDLKPGNVMLGSFGEVRVVDWGLARREGVMADRRGTRGYAPPEQWLHHKVDPRADVYALGRILEEILRGVPPRVTPGPHPPSPPELEALVDACTAPAPEDRLPNAAVVARQVRAWLEGAVRQERAQALVQEARPLLLQARAAQGQARALREHAEALLEEVESWAPVEDKIEAWDQEACAERLEAESSVLITRYEVALRGALEHDPTNRDALDGIGDLYRERLVAAERAGQRQEAIRVETLLAEHDGGRHQAWLTGTGAFTLVTDPPGAQVTLERFVEQHRRLVPVVDRVLEARTPLVEVPLEPGSWLLRLRHPECEEVLYPVFVERGEHWHGVPPEGHEPFPIHLPRKGELGADDCYVPAGWFISGGDPEAVDPLPRRRIWVDGFLMRKNQVTVTKYVRFLNTLEPTQRTTHTPAVRDQSGDVPLIVHNADGSWTQPGGLHLSHQLQPHWPAIYLTWQAARTFCDRIAGATDTPCWRLPVDAEWEKAARGADGRIFPWGNHLDPAFTRILKSQRQTLSPTTVHDVKHDVGLYGVCGLAGNARDWCNNRYQQPGRTSHASISLSQDQQALVSVRGGLYYSANAHARTASRFADAPHAREVYGIRPTCPVGLRAADGGRTQL